MSLRVCLLGAVLVIAAPTARLTAQSLRGSPASVERMYTYATAHRLHFYETTKGVENALRRGTFVRLNGNGNYRLHGVSFPYVRPSVRLFVERLAAEYRGVCGRPLVVTSAMRPESHQPMASPAESVHPVGIALDIHRPRRWACLRWLRHTLLQLEGTGVIEATEEHYPAHFHVAVFPVSYLAYLHRRATPVPVAVAVADHSYRVRNGDSLWAIAHRLGTTVSDLQHANGLRGSLVRPGQMLHVPN